MQRRANLLGFGLSVVVKVRELIGLPQRQQERSLRSEFDRFQARPLPPGLQRREIHVGRQVLISRRRIEILAHSMSPVCQQSPAHVALIKQLRPSMPVIDRQHKSALDAPANFRNPVACLKSRFRVLVLGQPHSLC